MTQFAPLMGVGFRLYQSLALMLTQCPLLDPKSLAKSRSQGAMKHLQGLDPDVPAE
jgi:hypothetical protein